MPERGVAIQNTINVKALSSLDEYSTGTHLQNKVAEKDLEFWIPRTKPYVPEGVPKVSNFDELIKLPIPQIGCILSIILQIIRKGSIVKMSRP